ncbi:MAG TPA: ATP-binding cassette domain-containing protein [Bacteroidia bacterium]|nr:ATP-binding cassette domain-containing protein [Bacteroidia bacterium]
MKNNKIHPVKRLFSLLKNNKKEVGQIYWLALFYGLISLSLPFGIQYIINFIQGGTYSTSYFVLVFLITLGVIIYSILQIIELRILENIQQKIFTYAGFDFTYRFPKIKIEELLNINARDLANRFFDSIVLEKSIIKLLTDFSISAIQIIISALVLSLYHSSFMILNLIAILFLYFLFKYTFERTLKSGLSYSKIKYKTAYWIEEVANASSTFKLAGITDLPMQQTDTLLVEYLKKRNEHYRWLNIQYIGLNITKTIYILGFLLIGGIMVMEQKMNIGQFVAAEVLVITIMNGIDKVLNTLKNLYDTLISIEKIAEVTDLNLENNNYQKVIYPSSEKSMHIKINNLNFKYPNTNKLILKNINVEICKNEKVLVTGEQNSGKSSFIKVLSSLYEITDGDILYNNISIKNIDLEKLRYDIGIYFKEDVIFNGTIWNNITLGRDGIDKTFLFEIIERINLNDELKELSNGLNTQVYSHGFGLTFSTISKILFLRAIATQPKLLLMENITLGMNKKESEKIIDIITDKKYNWTLVCIGNEEFANKFDTIYYLSNGQLTKK